MSRPPSQAVIEAVERAMLVHVHAPRFSGRCDCLPGQCDPEGVEGSRPLRGRPCR
jgi:hypothetical protein